MRGFLSEERGSKSDLVDFACMVMHQTARAYLIRSINTRVEAWVPKSIVQISDDSKTATLPERWAIEKGFI